MNDELMRKIQRAQVEAAEDVVIADLRAKGLLPPLPTPTPSQPETEAPGADSGPSRALSEHEQRRMSDLMEQLASEIAESKHTSLYGIPLDCFPKDMLQAFLVRYIESHKVARKQLSDLRSQAVQQGVLL